VRKSKDVLPRKGVTDEKLKGPVTRGKYQRGKDQPEKRNVKKKVRRKPVFGHNGSGAGEEKSGSWQKRENRLTQKGGVWKNISPRTICGGGKTKVS